MTKGPGRMTQWRNSAYYGIQVGTAAMWRVPTNQSRSYFSFFPTGCSR